MSMNKNAAPITPTASDHSGKPHTTPAMLANNGSTPATSAIQAPCLTMKCNIQ